ncbi:MAG: ribonuclease H-like domain-containing protein, partial [Candidatus Micrarchaeota archaeon]
MGNYYLDIETTGLDEKKEQIITIQFQELGRNTGKAVGPLRILKAWESSEKQILEQFIEESHILGTNDWAFISTGFNLKFEHKFLLERTKVNKLPQIDILIKPFIDLRAFAIVMNKGEFYGSGLDKITNKPTNGKLIPEWFKDKQYAKIIDYIEGEAKAFVQWNAWLYQEMPEVLEKFKKE